MIFRQITRIHTSHDTSDQANNRKGHGGRERGQKGGKRESKERRIRGGKREAKGAGGGGGGSCEPAGVQSSGSCGYYCQRQ